MAFPSPQAWPPVIAHKIEGLHLTHPSRAISAYTAAANEDSFSTQCMYAAAVPGYAE